MESISPAMKASEAAPARVGFWPRVGAALIDTVAAVYHDSDVND
jgi:hypothetical protein